MVWNMNFALTMKMRDNPQLYLLHNLAIRDDYFYTRYLNRFILSRGEKGSFLNRKASKGFFKFLCREATRANKEDTNFTAWLENQAEIFLDKGQ